MIRLLVLAFVLLPPAGWQPIGRAGITGVVRSSGEPVQGATVTVAGVGANARAVIREDGAFTFPDLVDGEYLVTIELAGFQTERRTVSVHQGVAPGLALPLRLATLEHVDFVVWPLPQSLARADAVAHLRIEQTEPSGRCGGTVGATHLARVLSVAKGSLPASIRFGQVNAGSCLEDDGRVIKGFDQILSPGDELIVFLIGGPDSFSSLAGRAAMLPIEDGRVSGEAPSWEPIRTGMTVEEVWSVLQKVP